MKISAAVSSTPSVTPAAKAAEWTTGWRPSDCSSGEEDVAESVAESAISEFNAAMGKLNEVATTRQVSPLTFQLKTTWDEAKEHEKEVCIDKATEACSLVCEIIAPKAAQELLQSCCIPDTKADYEDLVPLMQAYNAAKTRNVKTQILSLYAYRYPARTLQRIHEPFAKLTSWQIKRARAHARECSPGSLVEKPPSHRVRLLPATLDHFLDFVNRPYFYQDVAFGTRKLKLKSGEKLTMPNIIRKVTRATMIRQYLKFCEEEQYEPLSRASLFRVLEVREASQQKSLSGLDNTAADGSAAFECLQRIVEELGHIGLEKSLADDISRSLRDGKKYLKTKYQKNCKDNESSCPDHCRKLGLSDPNDPNFQEKCTHEHTLSCPQCDDITSCLHKLEQTVNDSESLRFYSKEQKDDFLTSRKLRMYCTVESPHYESCKPGMCETRYTGRA